MTLLVLCPSYRRPKEAAEVQVSFDKTVRLDTKLIFAIGIKDSDAYQNLNICAYPEWPMVQRTNRAAEWAAKSYSYIGWIADDNRFETPGWDEQVVAALEARPGGVVYGNDCVAPGDKPSHVFLDSRIVQTLGWLHFPGVVSTYGDDAWEAIGRGLGTLRYLSEVKVRHLYREKNNQNFITDGEVFQHWVRHDLENDLAKLRRALKIKPIAWLPDSLRAMTPPLIL